MAGRRARITGSPRGMVRNKLRTSAIGARRVGGMVRRQGYACSCRECLNSERRALRHDGVAESLQPRPPAFGRFSDAGRLPRVLRLAAAGGPSVSVQPAGKPISISTHSGVIAFPACDTSDPA